MDPPTLKTWLRPSLRHEEVQFWGDQLTVRPMLRNRCPVCLSVCLSVCNVGVGLLWPNGWMDQDANLARRYSAVGRNRPRQHRVRWDPAPHTERGTAAPTLFGPCLLWPNGWIDQDATWYGGRPQPRLHCVRWGPSSPTERSTAASHFFAPTLFWHGRPSPQLC